MIDLLRLVFLRKTRKLKDADIKAATFVATAAAFRPYYEKNILPRIREYELKRVEALRKLRARAIIAFPIGFATIGVVLYYAINNAMQTDPALLIFATVLPVMGLSWWSLASVRDYRASVKDEIYPLIFGFFGTDFKYEQESPVTVSSLHPFEIIPGFDTEYAKDYVRGTYKDTAIELLEAKMTRTEGTGKNRRTVTVFKGVFVRLGVPKAFKGKTIIRTDHGMMNWLVNAAVKRQRVKLEDPVFEKHFEVLADDQVEARYLLTTSFMERLLKLTGIFETKGLQASFANGRLLLMIPSNKDYFKETSIFRPATFVEEINHVLTEMKLFFDIIDILKLNEKTGL